MVQFVGMSGGGGVVQLPRDNSDLINLQLLQQALGSVGDIGTQIKAQADQQALAEALGGTAGTPAVPGQMPLNGAMGPPTPGTPAVPGAPALLPPNLLPIAQQLARAGKFDAAVAMVLEHQATPDPVSVREGGALVDPRTGQVVFQSPGAVKPPQMRDVLEGGERVFQEFDPATGGWLEVGRGPAFAPPTQINVGEQKPITGAAGAVMAMAPNNIADLPQIEASLFPNGEFDRTVAGAMMMPGTTAAGIDDAMMAGIMTILRAESQGTINAGEIDLKRQTYIPSPLDNAAVARQKYDRYQRDLRNTLDVQQRGRGDAPAPEAPAAAEPGVVDQIIQQGVDALTGFVGGGESQDAPAATTAAPPKPGDVEDGFRFRGGDWRDPNAWEPVS